MNFISVCSGIEAASVAFRPLGWKAIAFSEIEPFPCAVLAHHYPETPNMGDMSKFREWPEELFVQADVIVGGPPCQAFSVAGLRNGLNDERGNLTLIYAEMINHADAVRFIHGKPPVIVLYENVPGLLSDKTGAYGCFLAALAGEGFPLEPEGGRWTDAGCVFGPKRAIAWRVLDAQYFQLAQRRRRVFVIASARDGFDPATVLFEWDGMRRDSPPSRCEGEDIAPTVTAGAPNGSAAHGARSGSAKEGLIVPVVCMAHGQGGAEVASERRTTLTCNHEAPIVATCVTGDITHTLRAEGFDASEDGTGRGQPIVVVHGTQDPCVSADTAFALGRNNGGENVIAFDTTQITSAESRSNPRPGDPCHTLAAGAHAPAIAVSLRGRDGGATAELGDEVQNCLRASGGGGDKAHVLAPVATFQQSSMKGKGTIGYDDSGVSKPVKTQADGQMVHAAMQVRRLTPVECEKLQGFPPGYTAIPWRKKPASDCPDGPRYKALGNSWAVPCVAWIGQRINNTLRIAA